MVGKMFGSRRKSTVNERNAGQAGSPQSAAISQPAPRASELSRMARDLFTDQQFAAAIPVFQEAIDILRRSPKTRLRPYQGMLGLNLCLQATCLRQIGSTRRALASAEESAAILTAISGPDGFLLRSLETVALCLHSLSERPEDMAAAAMLAADLLARTSDPEPDRLGRRHVMLNHAANGLNTAGEIPEALRLRKEAIDVIELMAKANPARRHRLAIEYSSLAVLRAKAGEFPEAYAAADASETAMSDPEFSASSKDRFVIAQNQFVLGRLLVQNSHRSEALRSYVLAIDSFRALLSDPPEPIELKLGICLNNHAWNLCALGRQDEALPLAEESVDLLRATAASGPTERGVLSGSLDTLATALAMANRKDEALTACREALEIRRELAAIDREKHQANVASAETLQARITGREPGSFTER